jgi:putative nucleotidyltransferase with HDIG domain
MHLFNELLSAALEGFRMWRSSGGVLLSEALRLGQDLPPSARSGGNLLALNPLDEPRVNHMKRVATLVELAADLLGLDPEELRVVRRAALLHDFGKMVVPPSILNKPAELSDVEWKIVRQHSEMGAHFLSQIGESKRVCGAVVAHHEHWDGRGYPAGLAGQDIPIGARLIAVADAYDAMTSDRPYREALSHDEAIEELYSSSGTQFDPGVVEAVGAVQARPQARVLGHCCKRW